MTLAFNLTLASALLTPSSPPVAPFSSPAVADAELARVVGMGDQKAAATFRMADDLSAASLRQTISVGATIKDLWLIDFVSPLIAANVRATR